MNAEERCVVYVGGKALARYVLALLYKFNVEGCGGVDVVARGAYVYRAVSAVVAFLQLMGRGYAAVDVRIGTVALRSSSDERRVSKISIRVERMDVVP
ncbi:MAG: hypothetical protein DRO39_00665 [Thermoprotei archaeon]|nr:MAG: hypothetical protein DRO39_00665 [Thermoprotei archaeon]